MLFWKLPNDKYLAFIPRHGSTAWGQAILDEFYPAESKKQSHAATPDGKRAGPQYFIPSDRRPKSGQLLGVMRDPIERFRSGFSRAANGRTVDQLIDDLLANKDNPINIHIEPVSSLFEGYVNKMKWYHYETGLENLATDIGLSEMPEIQNRSNPNEKPNLTDAQIVKLQTYYADDMALYQ